ncbi:hypothetical protein F4556_007607 [Kitasatospora gansuensis]|uniref:Replication protein n=1 Tax=Kitasatospora gansuensis TaxID=258050 RepID=A0A7W7SL86_9ACTN|nr:hypothetical protein [Kitasatospora gansuensis]MBB4951953.1 hypothetical protein [Kitasatospora gansuensis]
MRTPATTGPDVAPAPAVERPVDGGLADARTSDDSSRDESIPATFTSTPAERAIAWAQAEQRHKAARVAGRANRDARRAEKQATARAARQLSADLDAALAAAGLTTGQDASAVRAEALNAALAAAGADVPTTPATAPSHPQKGQGRAQKGHDGGPGSHGLNYVSAAAHSQSDGAGCSKLIQRSDARLRQLDEIQQITGLPSVKLCDVTTLGTAVGVHVGTADGARTSFSGLVKCGSVWACPPCSAAIRARRSTWLEKTAAAWLESGRGIYMATLTAPHWRNVRLGTQFEQFAEGWRGVAAGSWWVGRAVIRQKAPVRWADRHQHPDLPEDVEAHEEKGQLVVWKRGWKARHGIAGVTRTIEVTYGGNGWHSHLHVLIWTEDPATREKAEELQEELYRRWVDRCKSVGLPTPDRQHGVRVDPVILQADGKLPLNLVRYLAKVQDKDVVDQRITARPVAAEMTRADMKLARGAKGLTAFQLAEKAAAGDEECLRLWLEYELATKGRQCLTWTEGLKERLAELAGIPLDDAKDEEIPAGEDAELRKEVPDLALASKPYKAKVARVKGRRADLRMAGDRYGLPGMIGLLVSWGLQPKDDFWKPEEPLGPPARMTPEQLKRRQDQREAEQARHEALRQEREGNPERWKAAMKKRAKTLEAKKKAAAGVTAGQLQLPANEHHQEQEAARAATAADGFLAARRVAQDARRADLDAALARVRDREAALAS